MQPNPGDQAHHWTGRETCMQALGEHSGALPTCLFSGLSPWVFTGRRSAGASHSSYGGCGRAGGPWCPRQEMADLALEPEPPPSFRHPPPPVPSGICGTQASLAFLSSWTRCPKLCPPGRHHSQRPVTLSALADPEEVLRARTPHTGDPGILSVTRPSEASVASSVKWASCYFY